MATLIDIILLSPVFPLPGDESYVPYVPHLPVRGCIEVTDRPVTSISLRDRATTTVQIGDVELTQLVVADESCR